MSNVQEETTATTAMEQSHEFVIVPYQDTTQEMIFCPEKELYIQVIPPVKRPTGDYPHGMLIISAEFYGRDAVGYVDATVKETYDFSVVRPDKKPENIEWNMDLFYEAIEYYAETVLEREVDGFSYTNNKGFYPFGGM